MEKREILKQALINALGTAIYVALIGSFMYFGSQGIFGENQTVFIPIAILMLFVFSAALTGFLIFGKPVMWYLNGKKKEALHLLFYTMGIFLVITLIALFFLVILGV